jgi:predicted AlkP superfamily pyrophosphatase or phosphodiesterase
VRGAESPPGLLTELETQAVGMLDQAFRSAELSRADRMGGMAAHLLRTRQPNLLLVHFVTTDSRQHRHGREHPMVERAVQAVDRGIARIVEAAEEAGILDQTTFIITGDHGFSDIHTVVAPNVWLVEAGFMEDRSDRGDWRATFHSSGASAFLKLRDPEDEAAVEEVRALLADLPAGTRRLFQLVDGDRMVEAGADPDSPLSLSGVDGVSMTSARSGAAVRPGSGGTHGHFPDFPNMETGFVAWGAGVQAGARVPLMGMEDIAPVVVELLGLEMETPDGVLLPGLVEGR